MANLTYVNDVTHKGRGDLLVKVAATMGRPCSDRPFISALITPVETVIVIIGGPCLGSLASLWMTLFVSWFAPVAICPNTSVLVGLC